MLINDVAPCRLALVVGLEPPLAWRLVFDPMRRFRHFLSLAAGCLLGAFAAGAAEPKVVALPPFLVEETATRLPWRYADVAGLEVLSSCPERLTRELIAN